MNVDLILSAFNEQGADCILIGGMNFFLVHQPVSTFDVDLWVADDEANLRAVHQALSQLSAEVSFDPKGECWQNIARLSDWTWLLRAPLFCLNSPHGAIDVFRHVRGLEAGYDALRGSCPLRKTPTGVSFRSLSDSLMIQCQLALSEAERKQDRLRALGYRG
jgi:hypothetical protein